VTHSKDVTINKTVERRSVKDGDVVLRSRQNKNGQTVFLRLATDDEILNTENALVSKALRTTGLRLVPGWLIDECMEAVRATRQRDAAADPDAAKRKLLDAFSAIGVSVDDVKAWLGHEGSVLQPKELDELRGIYTSIRDGDTTWRDVMDARSTAKPAPAAASAGPLEPGKDPAAMQAGKARGPEAVKDRIARMRTQATGDAPAGEEPKP
jgi:hypothetical protein